MSHKQLAYGAYSVLFGVILVLLVIEVIPGILKPESKQFIGGVICALFAISFVPGILNPAFRLSWGWRDGNDKRKMSSFSHFLWCALAALLSVAYFFTARGHEFPDRIFAPLFIGLIIMIIVSALLARGRT